MWLDKYDVKNKLDDIFQSVPENNKKEVLFFILDNYLTKSDFINKIEEKDYNIKSNPSYIRGWNDAIEEMSIEVPDRK